MLAHTQVIVASPIQATEVQGPGPALPGPVPGLGPVSPDPALLCSVMPGAGPGPVLPGTHPGPASLCQPGPALLGLRRLAPCGMTFWVE